MSNQRLQIVAVVAVMLAISVPAAPALGALPAMTRDEIACRADSGMGYSYWWGGSCWCKKGCAKDPGCDKGKCTPWSGCGGCVCNGEYGTCSHSGKYGADCSGFTYTVWRVAGLGAEDTCGPHGPKSTTYMSSSSNWTAISSGNRKKGDAIAKTGHVMVFEKDNGWGKAWVWEQYGCKYVSAHHVKNLTFDNPWKVSKRNNIVEGVCSPGQTDSQACGNCGTKTRKCSGDGQWGGWSGCTGQGACAAGESESQACGNCGTMTRKCSSSCQWGGWSGCAGQGVCAANELESQECGDCGATVRLCDSSCQWQSWSSCQGEDPGGGQQACGTGLMGICAQGVMRCIDGWLSCEQVYQPSAELCDDLDNDCNGNADDGYPTKLGQPPPAFAAEMSDCSYPTMPVPGANGYVWVDFRNVGTENWKLGQIWLSLTGEGGAASPLSVPGQWPAWDTPATLGADVPPGAVARFEFPIAVPDEPGAAIAANLVLRGPGGAMLKCPSPYVALDMTVLGGPNTSGTGSDSTAQSGQNGTSGQNGDGKSDDSSGCSAAPAQRTGAYGWAILMLACLVTIAGFRRRRYLGLLSNGESEDASDVDMSTAT